MNAINEKEIVDKYLNAREKHRAYMRKYTAEHPEKTQATRVRHCIKYLSALGYTVIPPEDNAQ